jgi:hypothetical protein
MANPTLRKEECLSFLKEHPRKCFSLYVKAMLRQGNMELTREFDDPMISPMRGKVPHAHKRSEQAQSNMAPHRCLHRKIRCEHAGKKHGLGPCRCAEKMRMD